MQIGITTEAYFFREWINDDFKSRSDMYFQTYAAARMLIHLVTNVYFTFIVPVAKFLIIGLVVFCVYSATRLGGFISLSMGFMGITLTGVLIVFFLTVAQIHAVSIEMRRNLESQGFAHAKRGAVGKVMKSLPDLKLWMGSELYYCDRVLVLTIAHVIAVQSINFLVGNPVE